MGLQVLMLIEARETAVRKVDSLKFAMLSGNPKAFFNLFPEYRDPEKEQEDALEKDDYSKIQWQAPSDPAGGIADYENIMREMAKNETVTLTAEDAEKGGAWQ